MSKGYLKVQDSSRWGQADMNTNRKTDRQTHQYFDSARPLEQWKNLAYGRELNLLKCADNSTNATTALYHFTLSLHSTLTLYHCTISLHSFTALCTLHSGKMYENMQNIIGSYATALKEIFMKIDSVWEIWIFGQKTNTN